MKCHACGRTDAKVSLRQVPGTTLHQCELCDQAVPVPRSLTPIEETRVETPRGKVAA